jgi:hypothetical protein
MWHGRYTGAAARPVYLLRRGVAVSVDGASRNALARTGANARELV